MILLRPLLLCALSAAALPALAQYKWTDADGRTVFGDTPPAGARNVQRLDGSGSASGTATNANFPYELRIAAERFPVTLYTGTPCAPCDQSRNYLRQRGVPFTERTVTYREEAEKMQRDGLGDTLPVATVGRQVLRGFDAAAWKLTLDVSGYPEQSRLPAGWKPAAPQPLLEPPKAPPPAAQEAAPRPKVEGVRTPNAPLTVNPPPPPPSPAN
jgi:glutaredoxin